MSLEDFYQADEIAKLRIAALRREEQELASEKEKLERERNLHVRELKRITNEEASRFHPEMPSEHVALTPRPSEPGRYLPLCLLGARHLNSNVLFWYNVGTRSCIRIIKRWLTLITCCKYNTDTDAACKTFHNSANL